MSEHPQMPPPGFDALSVEQKETYIRALEARVRSDETPEWHLEELARRRAEEANEPGSRRPWREAMRDLRSGTE